MPEQYTVVGDTVREDLPETVTEADLLERGYTPAKAWFDPSGDLLVFAKDGQLHDVGFR